MKTYSAKQFADVPAWQQAKSAKQAKKQAKQFKQNRNAKRSVWAMEGAE